MQEIIRNSKINPISQVRQKDLLDPNFTAKGIIYLTQSGEEYLGQEVDVRDSNFYSRIDQWDSEES